LVGSATTNYAFTGLSNGTAYTFRVAALNAVGRGSASVVSDSVVAATVASAPRDVSASPGNGFAYLSWVAPTSDGSSPITDYEVSVYNSSGGAATGVTGTTSRRVGSPDTDYLYFTGLSNGTAYTFRVAALNAA